jgi:hypothetical protein
LVRFAPGHGARPDAEIDATASRHIYAYWAPQRGHALLEFL